jgi:hypothetical protein
VDRKHRKIARVSYCICLWVISLASGIRQLVAFFPRPLTLEPNSGLGRLYETFHFTSVTRSRTVGRVDRTPWTGDQFVTRPLPVHKHRETHATQTLNIHVLSGIRAHGPGVRASEDSSCHRPLGYCDRPLLPLPVSKCPLKSLLAIPVLVLRYLRLSATFSQPNLSASYHW